MGFLSLKIHLLGPSGSGTTTLGKALASSLGIPHYDSDDFFWIKTDPPFTAIRPRNERIDMLKSALDDKESWILSGSALDWGDFLKPRFSLVIYKYVCPEIRIPRLIRREVERYGDRIKPGNCMHSSHRDFILWAENYETGDLAMRSRASEELWMKSLTCKIIRMEKEMPVQDELGFVLSSL
jgi:adenylate kinase family enzyme